MIGRKEQKLIRHKIDRRYAPMVRNVYVCLRLSYKKLQKETLCDIH